MIGAFNSLKSILALMIFIHHLGLYNGGGSLAVAVFFVLGGFLSTLGYRDNVLSPNFSYKNYILGKTIKFYPLHLLLLLVAVPLMLYGSSNLFKTLSLIGINASLFQSWIPIESVYFSGNAVSWYLSDTLAFVAVFPFILKWMLVGSKQSKVIMASCIALAYILLWLILPQEYTHRFFYINPLFRVIDYMVGMATALCYLEIKGFDNVKEYVTKNTAMLNVLALICFIGLIAISFADKDIILHSIVYMPLSCILLVVIALTEGGSILQLPILQKFGSISFAFFLVHQMCLRYLHILLRKLGCEEICIIAPIAFILTIIASYLLTYKFDKQISLWLKKKILNQQSMTAQS